MAARVLVTTRRLEPLGDALRQRGCDPVHVPLLETAPTGAAPPPGRPDFALVTSATAAGVGADLAHALGGARVFAVGARTAQALEGAGLRPAWVGAGGGAAAVAALAARAGPGDAVWHVGATRLSPQLAQALAAWSHPVQRWAVYETRRPPGLAAALARAGRIDVVTLASGSAARAWAAHASGRVARVVVLGPSTADDARAAGLAVHGVASARSLDALAAAAAAALSGSSPG